MVEFPFILADIGWIQIVIFILFVLAPLLTQLKGGGEAKQQRKMPQKPGMQPPGQANAGNAPQAGGGRAAVEAEIEDFLRRAGGAREQRKPAEAPAQPPVRRLVPQRDQAQPLREAVRDQVIVAQTAEPTTQPASRKLGDGVAQHVQEHIQSHPVTEHSGELGRSIGSADERLESRLHRVFDHSLGKIKEESSSIAQVESVAEGTDAAVWETTETRRDREQRVFDNRSEDIAAMLRDPTNVQQAVILSEILRRPNFAE